MIVFGGGDGPGYAGLQAWNHLGGRDVILILRAVDGGEGVVRLEVHVLMSYTECPITHLRASDTYLR